MAAFMAQAAAEDTAGSRAGSEAKEEPGLSLLPTLGFYIKSPESSTEGSSRARREPEASCCTPSRPGPLPDRASLEQLQPASQEWDDAAALRRQLHRCVAGMDHSPEGIRARVLQLKAELAREAAWVAAHARHSQSAEARQGISSWNRDNAQLADSAASAALEEPGLIMQHLPELLRHDSFGETLLADAASAHRLEAEERAVLAASASLVAQREAPPCNEEDTAGAGPLVEALGAYVVQWRARMATCEDAHRQLYMLSKLRVDARRAIIHKQLEMQVRHLH